MKKRFEMARKGVYFIENTGSGRIKIGYAVDALQRFHNIQVANDERVRLLGVFDVPAEFEKLAHKHFARFRYRGEWFDGVELLHEFIRRADESEGRSLYEELTYLQPAPVAAPPGPPRLRDHVHVGSGHLASHGGRMPLGCGKTCDVIDDYVQYVPFVEAVRDEAARARITCAACARHIADALARGASVDDIIDQHQRMYVHALDEGALDEMIAAGPRTRAPLRMPTHCQLMAQAMCKTVRTEDQGRDITCLECRAYLAKHYPTSTTRKKRVGPVPSTPWLMQRLTKSTEVR